MKGTSISGCGVLINVYGCKRRQHFLFKFLPCIDKLAYLFKLDLQCKLFISLDPPSAPLQPKFIAKSLTSVILSWIPPNDSFCAASYTLNLTNVTEEKASYTYNTTTNTTSMTVSDLTQGAEYSFTVAGVDAEGREGENSNSSTIVKLDSEYQSKSNIPISSMSEYYIMWVYV